MNLEKEIAMSIIIDCHGESHVGQARPSNEDQFLIADLNKSMRVHQTSLGLSHQTRLFGGSQGKLLLVADGVGGHESGERASTLAVDGVANYVLNAMDWFIRVNEENEEDFKKDLKTALHHSQAMLDNEAEAIPQRRGMATTLTMAYVDWPQLYVVHAGDTRCYHVSDASITQLTTDHSLAQLAVAAHQESRGKTDNPVAGFIPDHRMQHVLYNVVGGPDNTLNPEISKSQLAVGDILLLCSDGLTRYVNDDELLKMVTQDEPAETIAKKFVATANERGGKDNITVVVARFLNNETTQARSEEQSTTDFVKPEQLDIALANAKTGQVSKQVIG